MQWLRLYHEARNDAKLESLPDDQFRVWFRLLCFANEQVTRGLIAGFSMRLLAVEVARGDVALLTATLESLRELRIIDTGDDGADVGFINWHKRQFASDDVNERVKQSRDRARQGQQQPSNTHPVPVTLHGRYGNVAVTPPDTEADTDPETDPQGEVDTAAVAVARAPAREAPPAPGGGVVSHSDPQQLAVLCGQVTQAAGLNGHDPQKLARILARYRARAPADLLAEAAKAAEWASDHKGRKMSVRFLDNWLQRAFRDEVNGHDPVQRPPPPDAGRTGGQPPPPGLDLPDPHRHGVYAGFVRGG